MQIASPPRQEPQLSRRLDWREAVLVLAAGMALLAVFGWLYLPYMPTATGTLGVDYAFTVPNLLAGYYWFMENGPFALPWFSPAQCGGVAFYADAAVMWFSLPQFLAFVVPPLTAVRLTFLAFALAGWLGAYALVRVNFQRSAAAAAVGGVLFMFNSFYTVRMLIGHISFHPFMLTPLLAVALLPSPGMRAMGWAATVLRVCAAGLLLAVMLQAGMVHVVPAVLLGIPMIALMQSIACGRSGFSVSAFAAAIALAALLAAGKMAALIALIGVFPRTDYSLPGFPNLADEALLVLRALFLAVPENAQAHLRNLSWVQDQYEFEIGVTIVPLLLAAAVGIQRARQWRRAWGLRQAGLVALLALPLLLNWYEPHWNAVLKMLPYFRSSSNLLRWNAVYILPAVLLGALAIDAIRLPRRMPRRMGGHERGALAGLAAITALVLVAGKDPTMYASQSLYPPAVVNQAWRAARQAGRPPPITAIAVSGEASRAMRRASPNVNNAVTVGYSHRQCYWPIFGYRNENLSIGNLTPTAVMAEKDGLLNLKNPACYLFPRENHCLPGANFEASERIAAQAFVAWKPYPFVMPFYMRAITILNLIALLATLLAAGWASVVVWRRVSRQPR